MKYARFCLITLNVLARLFGGLAILTSLMLLASVYAIQENRIVNIVVGLAVGAMGIAFLVTKPVNAERLASIRSRMGSH
jgi:phosphatidylserine synthase